MAEAAEEEKGSARRPGSGEKPRRLKRGGGGGVTLEGYVPRPGWFAARTRSLTDEDLEELKGCLDLGFGFSYEEIPRLCDTLPALELCYSLCQSVHLDAHRDRLPSTSSSPVANWRFSSPGDDPDEVKARLKYWAQAVACTVRLCSLKRVKSVISSVAMKIKSVRIPQLFFSSVSPIIIYVIIKCSRYLKLVSSHLSSVVERWKENQWGILSGLQLTSS
ncbi:hypothetical protein OPV22_004982 [Ensete ventricosum]|uniref:Uncharacterized protein n=1 Tax=Ensete ventricosum TaxID=4639 RepID=A0AAV8RHG1_ENSVE|nr:hypothetical protein OPV22_004982 [Ensete ventricosum]